MNVSKFQLSTFPTDSVSCLSGNARGGRRARRLAAAAAAYDIYFSEVEWSGSCLVGNLLFFDQKFPGMPCLGLLALLLMPIFSSSVPLAPTASEDSVVMLMYYPPVVLQWASITLYQAALLEVHAPSTGTW